MSTTSEFGGPDSACCRMVGMLEKGAALTQVQLRASTGLAKGTVSKCLTTLIEHGYVKPAGSMGRRRLYARTSRPLGEMGVPHVELEIGELVSAMNAMVRGTR